MDFYESSKYKRWIAFREEEKWNTKSYKKWMKVVQEKGLLRCGMVQDGQPIYDPFATENINDYYFDFFEPRLYKHYIESFIVMYKSSIGTKGGDFMQLLDWQRRMVYNLFGWKRKSDGLRRYNDCLVYIPRKNGKSALIGGLGLPFMRIERMLYKESGLECIIGANTRDQAGIVFDDMKYSVKAEPNLRKVFRVMQKEITAEQGMDKIKTITADATKNDGSSPNLGICDEIHEFRDSKLPDVITSGQGARKNPLYIEITTASSAGASYCNDRFDTAVKIIEGTVDNPNFLPVLFYCDDEQKWEDEEMWYKCNPSLGVAKGIENMRIEFRKAKTTPLKENDFKRKQLNIITSAKTRFLDVASFRDQVKVIEEHELLNERCWGGLDMGYKNDMCAFVLEFPTHNLIKAWYWLPSEHEHREHFARWQDEIIWTNGKVIDFKKVKQDIVELSEKYDIRGVAFDPWKASELCQSLRDDHNIEMHEFAQTPRNYSEPLKDIEVGITEKRFWYDGSSCFLWQCGNAEAEETNDNLIKIIKPKEKNRYLKKIDAFMGWTMAHAMCMFGEDEEYSAYEDKFKNGEDLF